MSGAGGWRGPVDLREIAGLFAIAGELVEAIPHGSGHIHDTFAAVYRGRTGPLRVVHQRINHHVFAEPAAVMHNVEHVLRHLHRALERAGTQDPERRALTLVPARDGRAYARDHAGGWWRTYRFVEGAVSHDRAASPAQARQAACAFGSFQRLLLDYDGPPLVETIPGFHDTRARVARLRRTIETDPLGRAAGAGAAIERAQAGERLAGVLLGLEASGAVPRRIAHNDTKLNNVLFDAARDEALCVIDLDTVMPGLSLCDFGDMVRSMVSSAAEDAGDLAPAEVRVDVFGALVAGYLEALGDRLLPVEREHLVVAGQVLTYECGVRFLTDHLEGDTYFRIGRPGQNLERARAQFALLDALEARRDELERVVERETGDSNRISPDGG